MKNLQKQKGFTLIELLVVIAIIAILATIVLTSLSGATGKASNSKIQATLATIRDQANMWTTTGGGTLGSAVSYATTTVSSLSGSATGNLFTDTNSSDTSAYNAIKSLPAATAIGYSFDATNTPANGGKWAFAAALSTGEACTDYTGVVKSSTSTALSVAVSGTYTCN